MPTQPPRRLPWFRFYWEAMYDPKVQKLSGTLFKYWINILCLAAKYGGTLPALVDVGFELRISEGKARVLLLELSQAGLLDEQETGSLIPHNWGGRQYESDDVTARVRRYREQRNVSSNPHPTLHETLHETLDETPPDTDTDTDPEQIRNRSRSRTTTLSESREPPAQQQPPNNGAVVPVVRAFERSFGRLLSPTEIESIKALDGEHPRERIDYALREAAELGKRSVRYVQRICENQAIGGDNRDARKSVARNETASELTAADRASLDRLGITKQRVIVVD